MQPVQLEKAISNPDLRAGKVRQRSVASAENTEVAETEGDVIMMTTYNITILSCLFALNLWSVLWPICVQEWNYIMWPYVYPSYVYNVCRRQSSGGQLMSWLSRAQRGASSRTHLYSSNESVQGSQQVNTSLVYRKIIVLIQSSFPTF